ncbi:hypothetical protein LPTSP4_26540 [Leptospira ryugenii]|uniref:Uncharacterized protein n=1 Tax=Leptospira ryugenii TaxID=1917863 RepID=A0A2P2E2J4_9LEPT|nr:hypothetical protein [Leptospira ryugenii]GBF51123.1 hypothetical protein LPTSP4_26540 [Leptospira ryugenii]
MSALESKKRLGEGENRPKGKKTVVRYDYPLKKYFSDYVSLLDYDLGGKMFYLLIALLHEDLVSGRIDLETYRENVELLARDHERIKESSKGSRVAA